MIVLLGAGASAAFGIPTTRPFVSTVKERLNAMRTFMDGRAGEKDKLFDIIEQGMADFPLNFDLEVLMTVLSDLSMGKDDLLRAMSPYTAFLFIFRKLELPIDPKLRSAAQDLLSEVKEIVREKCLAPLRAPNPNILAAFDLLMHDLVEGSKATKFRSEDECVEYPVGLKVYTTNYDTTFEAYLSNRSIPYNKGIAAKYGYYVLDLEEYSRRNDKQVRLVKLHGSLDLFWTTDGNIVHLPVPKVRQDEIKDEVTTYGKKIREEFMVYPTEIGGYNYVAVSPFSDMLRMLRADASDDRYWIIIGSSLRDITIASLLNDLIRRMEPVRRSLQKVIIQAKEPDQILERLRSAGYTLLADVATPLKADFGEQGLADVLLQKKE